MIVKTEQETVFENTCCCLVDEKELAAAIKWYQSKPTVKNKKIYLHGSYPAVSIHEEKIHVHRLLMQYWLNTKIPFEYSVHHLNENKLDARKENLSLILNSTHVSKHNKGRIFSEQHRERISLANKKRKGIKTKKRVMIPKDELQHLLDEGCSINKIAKIYNCDWSTVKARIYENPELVEVTD